MTTLLLKNADMLLTMDASCRQIRGEGLLVRSPVAALLLCPPRGVDLSVINGQPIVRDGQLLTVDLEALASRHNKLAVAMAAKHPLPVENATRRS